VPARLLILTAALAVAYAVVVQPVGCNQSAHYALVQALGDGTPRIDRYHQETCDKSYVDGHYYAAKAPGLALVTEPWYLLLDAVGAVPANPALEEPYPEAMFELPRGAIWQLRLLSALLPALALVLIAGRVAERLQPGSGVPVAATLGLGTLVLPFATDFFAHALSAALGFGAFALLFRDRVRAGTAAAAGVCAGAAIVVELPLVLLAVALGLYALSGNSRVRRLAAYAAGAVAGALPLLAFNWWAFGSPVRLAYQNAVLDPGSSGHDVLAGSRFFGVGLPSPRVVVELLFSPRGLLVLTPVLALGWLGAVLLHRQGRRAEGLLLGLLPLGFVVYNAAYAVPFGGFAAGPRFLVPAIPFLAVGLAPVFALRRLTAWTLALVSAGVMVVATAAQPMLENDDTRKWLRDWADGDLTHTVVTLAGGGHGWLAIVPFVVAVTAAAAAAAPGRFRPARRDAATAALAVVAWVVVLTAAPDLLRVDALTGQEWGAVAVPAVALAAGVVVANAGSLAAFGGAPLLLLLSARFSLHTKQALALALLALVATLALARLSARRRA
jgi:hypothetical protein